ncbi:MAG: NAD(P)H-dependent oxidoreductase [Actinomycetota bacterium]|nr:NAD(P)H-dependent oxidoreductase [Actinomycetota bacterium]
MLVLGLSGSLRRDSHNRKLLRAAAQELPPGARLAVWEGLGGIPLYDQDLDVAPAPDEVRRLRDALASADAILISTPEYNHSIPGVLKNALDWASRPFPHNALRGKPVAVVGASTGLFGAVWAQAETRKVLTAIGANVVERELPVGSADSAFDAGGELVDPDLRLELRAVVEDLVREVEAPLEAEAADRAARTRQDAAHVA